MLARDVLVEVLTSEGVHHVFGNPGTTELPLIDALAAVDDPAYVLALQEATAVAMADGYAQVTARPAFLNLHTSAGLGNAIGNLTNAQANGTPLVVTAGQQDYRHIVTDPLLAGDLVGLATAVSKWVHEIRTPAELGTVLRRAFHDAASPPSGPVFVSLPMDLLDQQAPAPSRRTRIERGAVAGGLAEIADLLVDTDPTRLAIVVGDEASTAAAQRPLVELAELLAVPVHGSPLHGSVVFPTSHPLWAGPLPPAAAAIRGVLEGYDRVLLVGNRAFMVYPYSEGPALPPTTALLHLATDDHALGRTWPAEVGTAGDVAASLAVLASLVAETPVPGAADRLAAARQARAGRDARFEEAARAGYGEVPAPPAAVAHALVRAVPPSTPVVDEAITTGSYVRGYHRAERPGEYFFCRGGGLGWGMPAAAGVSLGRGREPVLCVVGDGSALYSPQALWTAAREELPVVFAVVNNRQYLILKNALRGRGGPSATTGRFIGMDLDSPAVDYLAMARSYGVDATLVEKADDVAGAVEAALARGRPHLLEIPIAGP